MRSLILFAVWLFIVIGIAIALYFIWTIEPLGWFFIAVILLPLSALPFAVRFTLVKEGTAKVVVRFGAYRKTLLAKEGYKVAGNGDIVKLQLNEEPPRTLPGGLRFVGFWPLDKVYTYNFDWTKSKPDGTFEDRHEEGVDHILVRDYVYGIRVLNAEDSDLLPLNILLSVTAESTNPYKTLFGVRDWFGAFVGRLTPYARNLATKQPYDRLQSADLEKGILSALGKDGIITELKNDYAINVRRIEVVDINPGSEYRQMSLQKKIGKMNADQAVEETAGRVLESVARTSGMTVDELKADLKDHPEKRGLSSKDGGYKEAFAYAEDQIKRDRAAAGGDLTDIRVGNTDGTSFSDPTLGSLIGGLAAATSRFGKSGKFRSGKPGGSSGSSKGVNRKKKTEDMADDELQKELDEMSD